MLAHVRAALALPVTVTALIPTLLWLSGARPIAAAAPVGALAAGTGGLLIAAGLAMLLWTVRLFARVGDGTLAPWDPPRRLVLRGPYRHVRNPMITGVLAILLGEAVAFRSPVLLYWFAGAALVNAVYLPLVEEPQLRRRFGADYVRYARHVPRWIPRVRPWSIDPAPADLPDPPPGSGHLPEKRPAGNEWENGNT